MQVDLILCYGYVHEKFPQYQTQNSHLKQSIFWGYGINNSILQ